MVNLADVFVLRIMYLTNIHQFQVPTWEVSVTVIMALQRAIEVFM